MGVTIMDSLDGKVAIVTGAGSGIGEAIGLELARRGAQVVIADINEDAAKRVAAAIADNGGQATASRLDVSQEPLRRPVRHTGRLPDHGGTRIRPHREHLVGRRPGADAAQRPVLHRQARHRRGCPSRCAWRAPIWG
jgi:hypothetical protein